MARADPQLERLRLREFEARQLLLATPILHPAHRARWRCWQELDHELFQAERRYIPLYRTWP